MKKNSPSVYGSNGFLMIIALAIVLVFVGILLAKGVNKKLDELKAGDTSTQQTIQIPSTQQTQTISQSQETQAVISTQQTQVTQNQSTQQLTDSSTPNFLFPSSQQTNDLSFLQLVQAKPLIIDGKDRVQYKISQFKKLATQPLAFKLFDANGKELTPQFLTTLDENKVHFFLISSDFKEYLHLYPTYENGFWSVKAYMPTPGTYYSYISIAPVKSQAVILRNELIVREKTQGTPKYPELSANAISFTAGYELKLTADALTEKRSNVFSFALTQNGKSVPNVQPYNGAFGHVMVFKQGNSSAVFPLKQLTSTDESKGRFDFMAAFSEPGRYTAFCEFFVGQKLLIFTLTFDIGSTSN